MRSRHLAQRIRADQGAAIGAEGGVAGEVRREAVVDGKVAAEQQAEVVQRHQEMPCLKLWFQTSASCQLVR